LSPRRVRSDRSNEVAMRQRVHAAKRTSTVESVDVTVENRILSREESLEILSRHHVGYVAISFHDLVRLKLCDYIYSEGWIYARAELGQDLTIARHHPWAAFDVAEVDGIYDWRSVEVGGVIEFLQPGSGTASWPEFENAVRLFRQALPQALTVHDPTPERVQLLRVHVDDIAGHESRSNKPELLPRP
jgi:nitroimidazol reductase NimA-like FMN-containing flavoprotein (pyridoxamine 5'-phosphate oxidase superfamily)